MGGAGGSLALSVCAIKTPIASTSRSTVCYPSVPLQHHSPRLWLQTERLPLPLPRPPAHSGGGGVPRPLSHTGCGNLSGVLWVGPRSWPHVQGYSNKGSFFFFYPVWPLSQMDLKLLENSRKLCFTVCVQTGNGCFFGLSLWFDVVFCVRHLSQQQRINGRQKAIIAS